MNKKQNMKLKHILTIIFLCLFCTSVYAQDSGLSDLDELDMSGEEETVESDNINELDATEMDTTEEEDEDSDEEESEPAVKVSFNGYVKAMNYWSTTSYSSGLMDAYRANNSRYGSDTNPDKEHESGYDITGIRTQLQMEGYLGDRARFYSAVNLDFNQSDEDDSKNNTETVKNNREAHGEDLRIVETYIEIYEGSRTWKAGTQLITWGFVDGFETPTDRLNARDYQYYSTEYEDTKMGSTGLLMTQSFDDAGSLDLLYIPEGKTTVTSYAQENLFAGGEDKPESSTANTKYAARYYGTVGKFDYAVSYVVGTDKDSDVKFVQKSNTSGGKNLAASHVYHRVKSAAIDIQYNFSDFIFQGGFVENQTRNNFDDDDELAKYNAGEEAEFVKNDWREYILGGEFMIGSATINLYAGQRFIDDWDEDDIKNTYTGQGSSRYDYISGYISGDFFTGDALNLVLYTSQFWDEHGKRVTSRNRMTLTYKIDDGLEVLLSPGYYDMTSYTQGQMQMEVKYSF